MNTYVSAVVTKLVADGVGVKDTDLFPCPEKPFQAGLIPVDAIFVFTSDGYMPEGTLGCGEELRRLFVEIQIRRNHDDFQGGDAKAEAIWQSLQRQPLTGITGFLWCRSLRSFPTYIGHNKDKHHIWTLRFEIGHMYS